ncbi:mitochondrial carrier protein rim2-like protein [Annulohypoxylon maeteangense]|uniref:mitochondrial carrier protein rim2-like protein n=1 Tax=Annulohypoxylon maeteangense TaxID=1927788 RepID=UPI00200727E3|nr:mitochondrial carrier protein rim2-like protein [Annulohypoxylon maeteangense]KAI0886050.1 mitochondrial carrier protein rim2-like protein [Annulohypoxylon maeteangense]
MAQSSSHATYTMNNTRGRREGGMPTPQQSPLPQSRELGLVTPEITVTKPSPFAKSWPHLVAGGVGGMTAAVLTAPLDVLKTRLQSDFYQAQLRAAREATGQARLGPLKSASYHLQETIQILRDVHRIEGSRALFKGLGPNLVGVVPARSINFYAYGTGKRAYSQWTGASPENPVVHLASAVTAGLATGTATNPIWLVKTRLQLDKNNAERKGDVSARRYRNSWDCIKQVMRDEGPRGFFKGLSASYLGVTESTLQWMMYEELKSQLRRRMERVEKSGREKTWWDHTVDWTGNFMGAGAAKGIASILTYPHEVARTRLRQAPMADGRPKYTGLVHCFKLVWKEEGFLGLYGGLTPHLMRTIPSAAIMFGMYEGILKLLGAKS